MSILVYIFVCVEIVPFCSTQWMTWTGLDQKSRSDLGCAARHLLSFVCEGRPHILFPFLHSQIWTQVAVPGQAAFKDFLMWVTLDYLSNLKASSILNSRTRQKITLGLSWAHLMGISTLSPHHLPVFSFSFFHFLPSPRSHVTINVTDNQSHKTTVRPHCLIFSYITEILMTFFLLCMPGVAINLSVHT